MSCNIKTFSPSYLFLFKTKIRTYYFIISTYSFHPYSFSPKNKINNSPPRIQDTAPYCPYGHHNYHTHRHNGNA